MPYSSDTVVTDILTRGAILPADIDQLRATLAADSGADGVELLLKIDQACTAADAAWSGLLARALAEHLVRDREPVGYLDGAKTMWLLSRIAREGRIERSSQLEALVTVIEAAHWAPPSLAGFALAEIANAVRMGLGPTRAGQVRKAGRITMAEIALVRRILLAAAHDRVPHISASEADALIDIETALADAERHPSWNELLEKAMLNFALGHLGYTISSTAAALQLGPLSDIVPLYRLRDGQETALYRLELQRIAIITGDATGDDVADRVLARLDTCSSEPARLVRTVVERLKGRPAAARPATVGADPAAAVA